SQKSRRHACQSVAPRWRKRPFGTAEEIAMTRTLRLSSLFGILWLCVVGVCVAGRGESYLGSFWWLFLLSFPASLISAILPLTPEGHFAAVVLLGLVQWFTIGAMASTLFERYASRPHQE